MRPTTVPARRARPLTWALALVVIAGTLIAMGQRHEPTKVAFVDVAAVINGLHELAALMDKHKARFEKLEAQVRQASDTLAAMRADIEGMKPDDPDRPDRFIAYRKLEASTKTENELNRSLKTLEEGRIVTALYRKTLATIGRIAQRDGYGHVLQNDGKVPLPGDGVSEDQAIALIMQRKVLYSDATLDLSQQVIHEMNNDFKAGKN